MPDLTAPERAAQFIATCDLRSLVIVDYRDGAGNFTLDADVLQPALETLIRSAEAAAFRRGAEGQREAAANIALAIDSGRGNEKEIAASIQVMPLVTEEKADG